MKFRDKDRYGSGSYRADRGSRLHHGVDVCCTPGDSICAVTLGEVTKLGYPYGDLKKRWLRYVQVTDVRGIDVRYFYIDPGVDIGDMVEAGDALGHAQNLQEVYPGITDHYHFEVLMMVDGKKVFLDPEAYLDATT